MKILDISMSLSEDSLNYPGDTPFSRKISEAQSEGGVCNMSRVVMSSHSGTHLDAPLHFVEEGKSIDQMPLDIFYGPVRVIDLGNCNLILSSDLEEHLLESPKRFICKTGGWKLLKKGQFPEQHPALTADAAELLVEKGIRLLGLDFITVDRAEGNFPVHNILLPREIAILEGLQLEQVEAGDYILAAFPLKFKGGDGSPCRAVLLDEG